MISTVYRWILLAPTLLPLFYVEGVMYPLIAPKMFALRTLALIALALFVYLTVSRRPFFWQRLYHIETWIPAGLLFVAYVTSFFGIDFYHSFWSTFERGDGLLTFTLCVAYFYLILLSADEKFVDRFVRINAWIGSLTAIYVILQWFFMTSGLDVSLFVPASGRVGGTMGNAAFLAAYLGMTLLITGAARHLYSGVWRTYLYIGAAFQVLAIILAATRGTLLAILVVAGLALVHVSLKGSGEKRIYARRGLAVFFAFIALFVIFRGFLSNVPFEPIRRLTSISLTDATVSSRLFVWSNVLRETNGRLFRGYGAEHVDIVFNRVYDPSVLTEEWFDRSHNAFLDYLVQFGVFGLLLYLALIGAIINIGWRLFVRGDSYGPWVLGLAGVYAVQNFFVFDTVVTLWLLLAMFAIALVRERVGESSVAVFKPTIVLWVFIAGLVLLIIPVSIRPFLANLRAFEAYRYQIVDVARAAAAFRNGLNLSTYADLEYGYNAYFMYTDNQFPRLSGNDLVVAYNTTKSILEQTYARYPYDARTALYYAQVLSEVPSGILPDREALSGAIARTIELSPKRVQSWLILVNVAIDDANKYPPGSIGRKAGYVAAGDILKQYITMVPNLSEPHFVLAQLKLAVDDRVEAAAEAALGKELYRSNVKTARRAAAYYGSLEKWEDAKFFLGEVVGGDPHDYVSLFDYAKLTYVLGDPGKASQIVNRLRTEQPAILETDQSFLSAITAYEARAGGAQTR
ncbi:MAG: O-antigen ligase family protein [bacterium]|nr:O-antigen ligase family protein [bacterium]